MDTILQDLMDQQGIHASMVIDGSGSLLGFRGSAIYDRPLLEGVASLVAKALDSVELLHDDWDSMQARFGDGSILVRNLGILPNRPSRTVVAVVADPSLNRSFATVAMRVVVQKLKQALISGNIGASASSSGLSNRPPLPPLPPLPSPPPPPAPYSGHPGANMSPHPGYSSPMSQGSGAGYALSGSNMNLPPGAPGYAGASGYGHQPGYHANQTAPGYSNPYGPGPGPSGGSNLSNSGLGPGSSGMSSGLSWSGVNGSHNQGSSIGVAVADEDALELLTKLTKTLAPFVGPMAKVFVKEAVREVCRGVPFGMAQGKDVAKMLRSQIEDSSDREQFTKSARAIVGVL